MHHVDPSRLDLAREYKHNPTGPHSPDLQKLLKLLGYADTFSVENGQPIAFKISAALPGRYQAAIVRLRCADHTGIGLKQTTVTTPVNGAYVARFQPVYAGSSVEVGAAEVFHVS